MSDVLRDSQASRKFREVAETRAIWDNLARALLQRSRHLVMEVVNRPISGLSALELKDAVTRTHLLERNLHRDKPRFNAYRKSGVLSTSFQDAAISAISQSKTCQQVILTTKDGSLRCWDYANDKCTGTYQMDRDTSPGHLIEMTASNDPEAVVCVVCDIAPARQAVPSTVLEKPPYAPPFLARTHDVTSYFWMSRTIELPSSI